jgi:hypothetical protein
MRSGNSSLVQENVMHDKHRQLRLPLDGAESVITTAQVSAPLGYRGLYAFHKYWGKKPFEPVSYVIENLTDGHEVILDPFVGSGVVTRESARLGRRFVGVDLNPIAIEISKLLISPPDVIVVESGFAEIAGCVRRQIEESYDSLPLGKPITTTSLGGRKWEARSKAGIRTYRV